jgi:hypothetical protein
MNFDPRTTAIAAFRQKDSEGPISIEEVHSAAHPNPFLMNMFQALGLISREYWMYSISHNNGLDLVIVNINAEASVLSGELAAALLQFKNHLS